MSRYLLVSLLATGLLGGAGAKAEDPPLPAGLDAPAQGSGDAPALPAGLGRTDGDDESPSLPAGLPGGESDPGDGATTDAPALPAGLPGEDSAGATGASGDGSSGGYNLRDMLRRAGVSGFAEGRYGMRTGNDPHERDVSIAETRLRLTWRQRWQGATFNVSGDAVYDDVADDRGNVNLHTGSGWFDLREAWAAYTPTGWMDLKVGRQVLTWGTGDLLFINDAFPKDWRSFFVGRDLEYLKAPGDAVKVGLFSEVVNLDVVYMPLFTPSRGITGERLSYYSPLTGKREGGDNVMAVHRPDDCFEDYELAARLHRRLAAYELAAYGYRGYWSTPQGMEMTSPGRWRGVYPRLNVYGASARGQLGRGIANVEAGYFDSIDDADGDDPFMPNSELRLLAGYEFDLPEVARDLTVAMQYYLEYMVDYSAYERAMPAGMKKRDRDRHVTTLRLTKLLMNQNLTLSFFGYYSPSDADAYLRPQVSYKIDDSWSWSLGGNIFFGKEKHTFFGQFTRNSNVFTSLRYSF